MTTQQRVTVDRAQQRGVGRSMALWSRRDLLTLALFVAVALAVLALVACDRAKSLPSHTQTVDGMRIELGVIPAKDIEGHPVDTQAPGALHGGVADVTGSHHITVALFDEKSGERISNARIRAGVGDRSYNHEPGTLLEPMQVNGTGTYGGFFRMPGSDVWRIHLEIERPGVARKSEAEFAYEHPPL